MKTAQDTEHYTLVSYDPEKEILSLDRSHSGLQYDLIHTREISVKPVDGEITLRCLMDRFSMKITLVTGMKKINYRLRVIRFSEWHLLQNPLLHWLLCRCRKMDFCR